MRRFGLAGSTAATLLLCSGCGVYVDDGGGNRTVFGLGMVELVDDRRDPTILGLYVEVITFGLSVHLLPNASVVGFGVVRNRTGVLRNAMPNGDSTGGSAPEGSTIAGSVAGTDESGEEAARRSREVGIIDSKFQLPVATSRAAGGIVIDVASWGFSISETAGRSAAALGWQRAQAVLLEDDVLVWGNPMWALDQMANGAGMN